MLSPQMLGKVPLHPLPLTVSLPDGRPLSVTSQSVCEAMWNVCV